MTCAQFPDGPLRNVFPCCRVYNFRLDAGQWSSDRSARDFGWAMVPGHHGGAGIFRHSVSDRHFGVEDFSTLPHQRWRHRRAAQRAKLKFRQVVILQILVIQQVDEHCRSANDQGTKSADFLKILEKYQRFFFQK